MTLRKSGKHYYGDSQDDIRDEMLRYSQLNEYVVQHFANAICACGTRTFRLLLDDSEGAAVRICTQCNNKHPIGDSQELLEDASLEECACPCGAESFEITIEVSLYDNSEDVKWLYVGRRCSTCGLTAVYGDWKNELIGYRELLTRV
jgi:hypothetical protein